MSMVNKMIVVNEVGGVGSEALVIGAGIAGASTAYFLSRAGLQVTVLDAGLHTASHVPSALINPVRGQSGQVDAQAIDGMHFTWNLIRQLTEQGHPIPYAQSGVLRPVPDDQTRAKFERNLPPELQTEWLSPNQVKALAPGWAHVLYLPEAGWVDGQALCRALLRASGANRVHGRWLRDDGENLGSVGHPPSAITVFCGGSVGCTWAGETGTHRMGSMLRLEAFPGLIPLSFGAYVSPDACGEMRGGVLGGTFEAPSPVWQEPHLPLDSLAWLLSKGEALTDLRGVKVTGHWTGSRLSGLRCEQQQNGWWRLTGLSSKGFLLGPLLASRLVQEITASRAG